MPHAGRKEGFDRPLGGTGVKLGRKQPHVTTLTRYSCLACISSDAQGVMDTLNSSKIAAPQESILN